MSNPFTNPDSFVSPSMNQVRLVDLLGIKIPLAWQNKTGYQLLGSFALNEQIRRKTAVLHLNPQSSNLIWELDACFESDDEVVRKTAVSIAKEYGRKLAYHQLVLKRGDIINRVVRPAWQDLHWAHWAQIQQVWLGGGLMAGNLGIIAAVEAQRFIRLHGFPDYSLTVSDFPVNLPLVGAARTAPAESQSMLLFDFGHTSIKRGMAHYKAGRLVKLEPMDSLPAKCPTIWLGRDQRFANQTRFLAEQTRDRIVRIANEAWVEAQNAGCEVGNTIALILACYMRDGQPLDEDWGCYGRLQLFSPHLQTYLAEEISERVGQTMQVQLLHDGQAAALPYAGNANSAVMTFGTALGIGFPLASDTHLWSITA